jgi:hypothetical protein
MSFHCPGIVREKQPALKIGFSGVFRGFQPAKWKLSHQTTSCPSSEHLISGDVPFALFGNVHVSWHCLKGRIDQLFASRHCASEHQSQYQSHMAKGQETSTRQCTTHSPTTVEAKGIIIHETACHVAT